MSNPFSNVDVDKAKIPLQQSKNGKIIKKKAGRPKSPNMQSYLIKMDKGLHRQISNFATNLHINKSAAISMAVRELLKKKSSVDPNKFYNINNNDNLEGTYIIKKINSD